MLPVSVPLLPVETVTLPAPRAVCNAVALITEGLPVAILSDELVAAALEMVTSYGSSNQLPDCPCGASVLMIALLPTWRLWPEVSTLPPLPPSGPPCALMLPLATVWLLGLLMSEYSTTCPPSPACVALASMVAPAYIVTCTAWRIAPLPCQSPPTSTVPPPVGPLASILLVAARVMSSASR